MSQRGLCVVNLAQAQFKHDARQMRAVLIQKYRYLYTQPHVQKKAVIYGRQAGSTPSSKKTELHTNTSTYASLCDTAANNRAFRAASFSPFQQPQQQLTRIKKTRKDTFSTNLRSKTQHFSASSAQHLSS